MPILKRRATKLIIGSALRMLYGTFTHQDQHHSHQSLMISNSQLILMNVSKRVTIMMIGYMKKISEPLLLNKRSANHSENGLKLEI